MERHSASISRRCGTPRLGACSVIVFRGCSRRLPAERSARSWPARLR
jgi:hypothetical protein